MLVIWNDSLPTPSSAKRPKRKETLIPLTRQETVTDVISTADTLVSQVTPLLGIMPHDSTQLQSTNTPEDIDGIVVNQPKHFLPLAQEAKKIAKEIRIEKINEQWAGIP